MAEIAGFKGLLFDPSRVEMDKVLAPPYDVIDDAGRQELAELDDKNCVRIILPEARGEADARYTHARQLLESWTEEGTLVQDAQPALYRYHQVFSRRELGDKPVTRRGFIAAVRLHDFDERVILRHERTLKGPKVDRLKLWESTRTHLSQIFTLYSDPTAAVDSLFSEAEESAPTIEGTTADGTKHLLWRVSDPAVLQAVSAAMDDKNLYIADGHHRYETMLALRDKLLAENPTAGPQSALRFGMMFLANIDDPGLVVLPTHRLVHSVAGFDATKLRERLREYFVLSEVAGGARDAIGLRAELAAAAQKGTSFALVMPGESVATILTLRSDVDLAAAAQSSIHYVKHTQVALDRCAAGEGQACFLMNATPVSQIVAVSDADEVMPQKSTFFYPKIASGMVCRRPTNLRNHRLAQRLRRRVACLAVRSGPRVPGCVGSGPRRHPHYLWL
jgi:uncharacterized protein (DUF1015 family)